MKLKRIDCPLMENYKVRKGQESLKQCDDYCWTIRKLFPENFKCCKNGKCLIIELTKNSSVREFICDFRESCIYGDYCPGHNGDICTFRDTILQQQKEAVNMMPPSLANKLAELSISA
ncbi:hypothetical protein K8R61_00765 [bacterium]|nr:hypothetical protein [bacterium]